ncbi:MAG TPA: ATP-binding protein [Pseudonocardia sp.]|uniref:DEAD/DEAH box helicase n=1 Tax=Pseudonocardia sp. TaxID=60912 RepID=UPI002F4110FC
MAREQQRSASVLDYWRAVETFNPPRPPAADGVLPAEAESFVCSLHPGQPAPWEPRHDLAGLRLKPGQTWEFTLYCGLYRLSGVEAELIARFGDDEYRDGPARGESVLFGLTVDANGYLVRQSAVLSSCAWALGRLTSQQVDGPGWLDGFERDELQFQAAFDQLSPTGPATAAVTTPAGSPAAGIAGPIAGKFVQSLLTPRQAATSSAQPARPVAARSRGIPEPISEGAPIPIVRLHEFVETLSAGLGVTGLAAAGIRVACNTVSRARDIPANPAFLNSCTAEDLARVARADHTGDIGPGLTRYLRDNDRISRDTRVDVRADPREVITSVEPRHIPGGRWPADIDKPLVLSQQFAVNQIQRELGDAPGLFAVHGPPGTGKTTMLRDIVANVVVQRAHRLADLNHPGDAFTEVLEKVLVGDRYWMSVRAVHPSLAGFEIVVATADNTAAENIGAEIPGIGAVLSRVSEAADYFPELATHVLRRPAWGLIAATLGKMQNRENFVERFWWGQGESNESAVTGMQALLEHAEADTADGPNWSDAVARFRRASAEVQRLAKERQPAADAIRDIDRHRTTVDDTQRACHKATRHYRQLQADRDHHAELVHAAEAGFKEADYECTVHRMKKPNWYHFEKKNNWRIASASLHERRQAAARRVKELKERREKLEKLVGEGLRELTEQRTALPVATAALHATRNALNTARARWPLTMPPDPGVADDENLQLRSPWADHDYLTARNQLFVEALRLHKAFALGAARQLRHNLSVAMSMPRKNRELNPATLLAAWQSFFLLVPVVSTTFSSLPRLFTGVGREAFGWLLVHEAGQASAQGVVGGIWRSRRTVLVGDPQQIEPIVSLPMTAQHALSRRYDVDRQWLPGTISAQSVADRLNRYGTELAIRGREDTVWVGAPLRVHRRCDRPFFKISNNIAYGGDLMIYGTSHRGEFPGMNQWVDVRSGESEGNWIPSEGDALRTLLHRLRTELDHPEEQIAVISPFRHAVIGSQTIAGSAVSHKFAEDNVGTVHQFQGREVDVVILVLGGDPRRPHGREWAASRPNLLNVAVSRAKRRLYVIGNHQSWRELPHFTELAAAIPLAR